MDMIWTDITAAWPNIALAWAALFLVAASPGPSVMAIMGISMARGRRAGMIFTAGCMTGATTWAVLAGLGLSVWLTSYANGIMILKICGGLYLLWMAFKSFKSALTPDKRHTQTRNFDALTNLFPRGLALHLTNPKAILGWAAVITLSQSEGGRSRFLCSHLRAVWRSHSRSTSPMPQCLQAKQPWPPMQSRVAGSKALWPLCLATQGCVSSRTKQTVRE